MNTHQSGEQHVVVATNNFVLDADVKAQGDEYGSQRGREHGDDAQLALQVIGQVYAGWRRGGEGFGGAGGVGRHPVRWAGEERGGKSGCWMVNVCMCAVCVREREGWR